MPKLPGASGATPTGRGSVPSKQTNSLLYKKTAADMHSAAVRFSSEVGTPPYETFVDCSLSVSLKRLKWESKVTNPFIPWKKAFPPVSFARRINELCP